MDGVTRLVTFVDIRDPAAPGHMSVSARHDAVLSDGSRVLLLDDRGWSSSLPGGVGPDLWASVSLEEIEDTARVVVGPDEPFGGQSREDADEAHWAYLADILLQKGVAVDPAELKRVPHDVVLAPRVLERVGGGGT